MKHVVKMMASTKSAGPTTSVTIPMLGRARGQEKELDGFPNNNFTRLTC